MNIWRNFMAMALAASLVHLPLAEALGAATAGIPASIRQEADQFGVGAVVRVKLAGGEKLRGSIGAIDDQSFELLSQRENKPRRISYDQVAQLQLAKRVYRASGEPDSVAARRVVLALGVGRHAVVKTVDGREFHGHIQAIEDSRFAMLPDNQPSPVQIAYSDVRYVEKNLSAGGTIVLVVLIVAAVVVAASVGATR